MASHMPQRDVRKQADRRGGRQVVSIAEGRAGRVRDKAVLTMPVGQGDLVEVQIADSARKHGVLDEDSLHALRNPLRVVAGPARDLVIAVDRSGRLLEVVSWTTTRLKSPWSSLRCRYGQSSTSS